ncbi:hypothetical protein OAG62_00465 [bacterium]|nr:hypothetical protein [bacterium]
MGGNSLVSEFFGGKDKVRVENFVRESIQNSLDARKKEGEEVVVHFRSGRIDDSDAKILLRDYVTEALRDHAKETSRFRDGVRRRAWSEPIEYLVVEDLNTTGLDGPVDARQKNGDDEVSNALTTFFRLNGVSGKSGNKLGSFGVGRHVFYSASRISTFFVHTTPISSHRIASLNPGAAPTLEEISAAPLLLGMSLQEERSCYDEKGHEAIFDNYLLFGDRDSPERGGTILPYGVDGSDAEKVSSLHSVFQCERPENTSGTSIVVLQPHKELSAEKIRRAVVNEFTLPILKGELLVKVDGKIIDSETIRETASSLDPKLAGQVDFLKTSIDAPDTDALCDIGIIDESSRIEAACFDDRLDEVARAFRDGELVTIEARLDFRDTDQGADRENRNPGTFHVHLQLPPGDAKGRRTVARSSLVIRGRGYSDAIFCRDYNGLVAIDTRDPLGAVLRHAEGPAHDEWKASRIDDRCGMAPRLIELVKSSADRMHALLLRSGVKADRSIFADLIPVGGEARPSGPTRREGGNGPESGPGRGTKRPGDTRKPQPTPDDLAANEVFRFDEVEHAGRMWYRIRPSDRKRPDANIDGVRIEVAYDIRTGSPFKKWSRDDFDLESVDASMMLSSKGLRSLTVENGQSILARLDEDPGRSWEVLLSADLFDDLRDLRVRGRYTEATS